MTKPVHGGRIEAAHRWQSGDRPKLQDGVVDLPELPLGPFVARSLGEDLILGLVTGQIWSLYRLYTIVERRHKRSSIDVSGRKAIAIVLGSCLLGMFWLIPKLQRDTETMRRREGLFEPQGWFGNPLGRFLACVPIVSVGLLQWRINQSDRDWTNRRDRSGYIGPNLWGGSSKKMLIPVIVLFAIHLLNDTSNDSFPLGLQDNLPIGGVVIIEDQRLLSWSPNDKTVRISDVTASKRREIASHEIPSRGTPADVLLFSDHRILVRSHQGEVWLFDRSVETRNSSRENWTRVRDGEASGMTIREDDSFFVWTTEGDVMEYASDGSLVRQSSMLSTRIVDVLELRNGELVAWGMNGVIRLRGGWRIGPNDWPAYGISPSDYVQELIESDTGNLIAFSRQGIVFSIEAATGEVRQLHRSDAGPAPTVFQLTDGRVFWVTREGRVGALSSPTGSIGITRVAGASLIDVGNSGTPELFVWSRRGQANIWSLDDRYLYASNQELFPDGNDYGPIRGAIPMDGSVVAWTHRGHILQWAFPPPDEDMIFLHNSTHSWQR